MERFGVVYSETIVHAAPPYQLAIIDLDGGGRVTVRLVEPAEIGERVRFIEERAGVPWWGKLPRGTPD